MHKHGHKVICVVQGKNSNSYMEVFKFYFNSWIWMWKTINIRKGREGVGMDQFWLDPCLTSQKTYGDRAFSIAGPKLWNDLPLEIRKCASVATFKQSLKTFLFKLAYRLWDSFCFEMFLIYIVDNLGYIWIILYIVDILYFIFFIFYFVIR